MAVQMPRTIRANLVFLVASAFILAFGLFVCYNAWLYVIGKPTNPTTMEEIQESVYEKLPYGSSTQDVSAWLENSNIPYTRFDATDVQSGIDTIGSRSIIEESEKPPNEIGEVIRGQVADTYRSMIFRRNVRLYFFFDAHERLVKFLIRLHDVTL